MKCILLMHSWAEYYTHYTIDIPLTYRYVVTVTRLLGKVTGEPCSRLLHLAGYSRMNISSTAAGWIMVSCDFPGEVAEIVILADTLLSQILQPVNIFMSGLM